MTGAAFVTTLRDMLAAAVPPNVPTTISALNSTNILRMEAPRSSVSGRTTDGSRKQIAFDRMRGK
ncbi:MAG: hypothetical protein E6G60_22390 [Actinobacteria bacterium]|nr:MAG: hypothetical protein E6G60_22390 [Actinomycetota bacterium]